MLVDCTGALDDCKGVFSGGVESSGGLLNCNDGEPWVSLYLKQILAD